jgi:hypothetical protein
LLAFCLPSNWSRKKKDPQGVAEDRSKVAASLIDFINDDFINDFEIRLAATPGAFDFSAVFVWF